MVVEILIKIKKYVKKKLIEYLECLEFDMSRYLTLSIYISRYFIVTEDRFYFDVFRPRILTAGVAQW